MTVTVTDMWKEMLPENSAGEAGRTRPHPPARVCAAAQARARDKRSRGQGQAVLLAAATPGPPDAHLILLHHIIFLIELPGGRERKIMSRKRVG